MCVESYQRQECRLSLREDDEVEHASGSEPRLLHGGVQRFMKHLQTCLACKQRELTTNCRGQKSYYEEIGSHRILYGDKIHDTQETLLLVENEKISYNE
ncbi:hypothetical protein PUN28_001609 [Cardiocondyla obscurior]|uniref:Uncharacterized protein n=1 Tax=Cardiocondyla obscurior TaxID=286306 RepID=A0AAW2GQA6_9HYME